MCMCAEQNTLSYKMNLFVIDFYFQEAMYCLQRLHRSLFHTLECFVLGMSVFVAC